MESFGSFVKNATVSNEYVSALNAAKSEANDLIIVGNGINLYVTRITVGGVTLGESTASDQR